MPAQGIHDAHAVLFDDLFVALETLAASRGLVGAKADIRKCFDSASPQAALPVWKHVGAPPGALHVPRPSTAEEKMVVLRR